jgi:hypothetical protein
MLTVRPCNGPEWKRPSMPGGYGGCFQFDVEDLRGDPLTEMAGCHRPIDEPGQFDINRIALTQQRRDLRERIRLHGRKCPTCHSVGRIGLVGVDYLA